MSQLPTDKNVVNMPSVVAEIQKKITDIKERIKEEGVSSAVFGELSNYAKTLQDKLDELLSKGGLLTQSDVNDAYKTLQDVQREELARMQRKSQGKLIRIFLVFSLVVIGAYALTKRMKKL